MSTSDFKSDLKLPPRPKEPEPYECCERGCDPCVYDYYAKALKRWEARVEKIKKTASKCSSLPQKDRE